MRNNASKLVLRMMALATCIGLIAGCNEKGDDDNSSGPLAGRWTITGMPALFEFMVLEHDGSSVAGTVGPNSFTLNGQAAVGGALQIWIAVDASALGSSGTFYLQGTVNAAGTCMNGNWNYALADGKTAQGAFVAAKDGCDCSSSGGSNGGSGGAGGSTNGAGGGGAAGGDEDVWSGGGGGGGGGCALVTPTILSPALASEHYGSAGMMPTVHLEWTPVTGATSYWFYVERQELDWTGYNGDYFSADTVNTSYEFSPAEFGVYFYTVYVYGPNGCWIRGAHHWSFTVAPYEWTPPIHDPGF